MTQILFLFEPYVLGKMIDGLLVHQYGWLLTFILIEFIANLFMYKRMVFDTKIFTNIHNSIIFKYLKSDKNSETSAKIARTEMAGNILNFFESDIHFFIMALLSSIGCIFFIFLQDIWTGLVVTLCVIPIVVIVKTFYRKIAQSTKVGYNQYENKIDILTEGNESKIETFFKRRRKILISGSTLQGKNWFSFNSTKTIFLVLALVIFTNGNTNLTQGQAVSMYSYINQFLNSLVSIPVAMETFTRIKDVINRIKSPI